MRLVESFMNNLLKESDDLEVTSPLELNTGTLPVLDTNTYGRVDDWYYYDDDGEIDGEPEWEDIKSAMISFGGPIIEDYIKKVLPSAKVEVTNLWSPQYYNFQGDELEFNVSFNVDEYKQKEQEAVNDPAFKDFLKERYKSYDGFISYLADDIDEFYQQEGWKRFVQVVMFFLRDEDFETDNERFWDDVRGNC